MSLPDRKESSGSPPQLPDAHSEGIMTRIKQPAVQVDDELVETLQQAQEGQWALVVQPPQDADDDVLAAAENLLAPLHQEFNRFSFEFQQTERGAIEFHFVCGSRRDAERIQEQLRSAYPRAEGEIEDRSRLPVDRGQYVTAARVEYEEDFLFPLLNSRSADAPDGDPAKPLFDAMASAQGQQCVLQTVIEPVSNRWTTRWARGIPHRRENDRWWKLPASRDTRFDSIQSSIALTVLTGAGWFCVTQGFVTGPGLRLFFIGLGLLTVAWWWATLFGNHHIPRRWTAEQQAEALRQKDWTSAKATKGERKTAERIAEQAREKSYRVSMRLLTIADSPSGAREHIDRLNGQLSTAFHDSDSTQQLGLSSVGPLDRRVKREISRVAGRLPRHHRLRMLMNKAHTRARRRNPMYMSGFELVSIAHLPDENSGGAGAIDFAPPRLRTLVPPAAPRYLRPGADEEPKAIEGKNPSIVRAGRLLADRLPAPLADRLGDRGVGVEHDEDGTVTASIPSWMTEEAALKVAPDRRETAIHPRYGEVELKLTEEGDPSDDSDSGDVHMGAFLREIIESKQQLPRDDILIGYQEQGGQVREVMVDFDTIYTHIFIQGVTGGGKSTLAGALLAQWAHAGHGFAVPDPSGDFVKDILRWLPEHRHDDVVYYSPEPDVAQDIIGINPLSITAEPGDQDYGGAVDQAVDAVENGLRAAEEGDQWGNRMIGVCRNLSRVMIRSDEPFTLVDLHDALSSEEGREKLAKRADKTDEWVAKYTRKIAEMDDSDLDAILRRINEWVESTVSRTTIAVRDSSLDLDEIVKDEKILLFDNKLSNSALSRMLATVVWSRVWDICEDRPEDEREPFCVLADEFDDYITPEMDVAEQLRNARKYKLSLCLMTQYLDAIGNKEVERAIDEECKTKITLPMKGDAAGDITRRLGLDDEAYLTKLADYHALVEISVNGKPRGPFEISLPAPVAPERTLAQARKEIVRPSLDRHGREPLTDQEISEEQILSGGDTAIEGTDAMAQRNTTALKAIEDTAIRQGCPGDYIALSNCVARLNDYLETSFRNANDAWRNALQNIPETQLAERQSEGSHEVRVLDRPWLSVGDDVSAGGKEHALIMEDAYQPLSQLGFVVDVLNQADGTANDSMPDGLAKTDDALDLGELDPGEDAGEIADRVNEFRTSDEHNQLVRLTGVKDGYLEAEHSTSGTQPSQAVMNAIEAANDGHRCLYLIRPELASKLHGYLAEQPAGCRSNHNEAGETRFYMRGALSIDGEKMTRPGAKDNVWIYEKQTEQYVLRDQSGTEHARFDTATEIFTNADAYPEGERTVTTPVIPWHELDGDATMENVEWDIIVVPEAETDENDDRLRLTPLDLKLYQAHADNIPLIDLPVSPSERATEDEEEDTQIDADMQAVYDALDDAENMFDD